MFPPVILTAIHNECDKKDLDVLLIKAIILTECSNLNTKAMRFEPTFMHYWKVSEFAKEQGIDTKTEMMLQKCSFGLMQIMGGTARGLGYKGILVDLLDPKVNIEWGTQYFKKNCMRYIYVNDQIAAYNAGSVIKTVDGKYSNQFYVDKVLRNITKLQEAKLRDPVEFN